MIRPLRWVLCLLLGALLVWVRPQGLPAALGRSPLPTASSATPPATAQAQTLIQQGVQDYQTEQYAEAIAHWQQALPSLTRAGDTLAQAGVWNYLSLAYQRLGQWPQAAAAIARSIEVLPLTPSTDPAVTAMQARALNTLGQLQWNQGQRQEALAQWHQAEQRYQQLQDATGVAIAQLNQANALQVLGFNVRAAAQLDALYQQLQQEPDPHVRVAGLRSLGNALRRMGQLDRAAETLQEGLDWASSGELLAERWRIQLDLGTVAQALMERAIAIGQQEDVQTYGSVAQLRYDQVALTASDPLLQVQAQLNLLQVLSRLQRSDEAVALAIALAERLRSLPVGRSAIEAQLNYVHQRLTTPALAAVGSAQEMAMWLRSALDQARQLQDPIAESYALGQWGQWQEQQGQIAAAQRATQQALLTLEAAQAPQVRYQWEWQLGRMYAKTGDRSRALAFYGDAVQTLASVRNDLLVVSADVQFSFRDQVEPVYREFVELLVHGESNGSPPQADLTRAIQLIDTLQLAELENFLGCGLAQSVSVSEVNADPTAAQVYPMILPGRLAVVLQLPGANPSLIYHEIPQPQPQVEAVLHQLRQDLSEPDRTPEAVQGLGQVYQWLIAPFEADLAAHSVSTLVFVLDGALRNIPMSALFDGNQYLIARYAVALSPRLELFNPQPRSPQLRVFLGGVDEPQTLNNRSFPKIENLLPELDAIQALVNAKQPLLNTAFTKTNLQQQLASGTFSGIHLKTHGVFSSEPDETFIVAYQELITGRDLGQLIQSGRMGEASAVELLVLSACSTAQGDNRAVLGLAGLAVQAGARSVVSTLWEAQDYPNTQLMIRFYQALANPQVTRAEALRTAQRSLIDQGYRAPHVWATYVLVGNWL